MNKMTLSTDQCIEVAEKIHNYSITWGKDGYAKVVWMEGGQRFEEFMTDEQIADEVLSWSGFGRTLEGMAEKGFRLIGNGADGFQFESNSCFWGSPEFGPFDRPTDLIQATHLNALEAIQEDK